MIGFWTLFYKEMLRFWKVAFQTVASPVLTALLYLLIFGHVLDGHVEVHGVSYTSFLIPGLVMMQMLQNAFANSSSSLIQAKVTGSIVFVLLPPIPYGAFFAAYVLASLVRGLDGRCRGSGRHRSGLPRSASSRRSGCWYSPFWAARFSARWA